MRPCNLALAVVRLGQHRTHDSAKLGQYGVTGQLLLGGRLFSGGGSVKDVAREDKWIDRTSACEVILAQLIELGHGALPALLDSFELIRRARRRVVNDAWLFEHGHDDAL
jgi:hypothetical protein